MGFQLVINPFLIPCKFISIFSCLFKPFHFLKSFFLLLLLPYFLAKIFVHLSVMSTSKHLSFIFYRHLYNNLSAYRNLFKFNCQLSFLIISNTLSLNSSLALSSQTLFSLNWKSLFSHSLFCLLLFSFNVSL